MFWRFGGYANISTIDTLLDKSDVTLEELLDESDLVQELKQHNTKLIEFLRDENVLKRLLEYVIAPGPLEDDEEEAKERTELLADTDVSKEKAKHSASDLSGEDQEKAEKNRVKYAFVACEILSSETWSILEALMQNEDSLRKFWSFLRRPSPLDPLQAGYFTKVNETLLEKKTEEMLDFLKSLDGIIQAMLAHVDCPMVMDLLLKIISLEKADGGQGIVDWLQSQGLIPTLLSYLSPESPPSTQTSAGDFLKAIITISANASQNEQSCIGPNSLTRQLVSQDCVESLVSAMLKGGNPLTVGVGIVIEVIRKNNSDYDPENGHNPDSPPSTHDPIYLGTLLRNFAKHIPDFMNLILSSKHAVMEGDKLLLKDRGSLNSAWGSRIEPLGFDRFKTCELMAELLHCSNMGLLNERGSEDFIHQRDSERERLRAQGAFAPRREGEDSGVDISEDSSQFTNGAAMSNIGTESPEDARAPNTSEDDGFERVTAPEAATEPERTLSSSANSTFAEIQEKTGLTLESDLVDEPLTPNKPDHASEKSDEVEVPQPLRPRDHTAASPAEVLEETVRRVSLDDTVMSSPPSEDLKVDQDQESQTIPKPDIVEVENVEEQQASAVHFDKTPTARTPNTPTMASNDIAIQSDAGNISVQSVVMEDAADRTYPVGVELEANGQPVVGDYLKLMFVENKVVPTILSFFFRFPWNNFLHNVVYDVVQQVFNGSMDRGFNRSLAIDVFETGCITEQIIDGQRKSDEAQAAENMRLGYMGHLTLVAEEVVKFSERHPPELLSQLVMERVLSQQWIDYVEQTLSDTRERDNAILGGVRPDLSVGPRQAVLNAVNAAQGFGASAALANAGLTGGQQALDSIDLSNNGSASGGAFGSSGGSLLSGFGSSSDDDDEEMDEADDDDHTTNATRAALQLATVDAGPQSENESDQPIPLLPPPPAPLNIPPSRARRQLAARLAEKQRAAEAEASAAGDSQSGSLHLFDSDDKNDPFKALDDDDVEDHNEVNPANSSSTRAQSRGFSSSVSRGISSLFSSSHKRPPPLRSDGGFDQGGHDFDAHSSDEHTSDDDESSEEGHALEATTSKERHPIDIDSDEEMGEMVAPSNDDDDPRTTAIDVANDADSSGDELVLSPIEREKLGIPAPEVHPDSQARRRSGGLLSPKSPGYPGRHLSFDDDDDEFGAEIGADKSGGNSSDDDAGDGEELVEIGMVRSRSHSG